MKNPACILLLVLAVPVSGTAADVRWNTRDFTGNALTNRLTYITPIAPYGVSSNIFITGDRLRFTNDSSGVLIVSNVYVGRSYRVEFIGPFVTTTITNSFDTNVTGFVEATDYIAAPIRDGSTIAFSQTAATARFHDTSGDTSTNAAFRGTIKIPEGATVGYVFTVTNADGSGAWQPPSGSGTYDFLQLTNRGGVITNNYNGTFTALGGVTTLGSFSGSGSGLENIPYSGLSGTAQATIAANASTTANNTFTSRIGNSNLYHGGLVGNLAGSSNYDASLPATQLTGTISDARLPDTISSDITGNAATATTATNLYNPFYGRLYPTNCIFVATNGNDTNSGLTDTSPKLTLTNAVATATNGQTIYIGRGTYSINTNILKLAHGVSLVGVDRNDVTIIGFADCSGPESGFSATGGPQINPGTNSIVSDFTLICDTNMIATMQAASQHSGTWCGIGVSYLNPPANRTFENVSIKRVDIKESWFDAFHFNGRSNCANILVEDCTANISAIAFNCVSYLGWTTTNQSFTVKDSTFICRGDNPESLLLDPSAFYSDTFVNIINCEAYITGGSGGLLFDSQTQSNGVAYFNVQGGNFSTVNANDAGLNQTNVFGWGRFNKRNYSQPPKLYGHMSLTNATSYTWGTSASYRALTNFTVLRTNGFTANGLAGRLTNREAIRMARIDYSVYILGDGDDAPDFGVFTNGVIVPGSHTSAIVYNSIGAIGDRPSKTCYTPLPASTTIEVRALAAGANLTVYAQDLTVTQE